MITTRSLIHFTSVPDRSGWVSASSVSEWRSVSRRHGRVHLSLPAWVFWNKLPDEYALRFFPQWKILYPVNEIKDSRMLFLLCGGPFQKEQLTCKNRRNDFHWYSSFRQRWLFAKSLPKRRTVSRWGGHLHLYLPSRFCGNQLWDKWVFLKRTETHFCKWCVFVVSIVVDQSLPTHPTPAWISPSITNTAAVYIRLRSPNRNRACALIPVHANNNGNFRVHSYQIRTSVNPIRVRMVDSA